VTRITDIRGLWPDNILQGVVSTALPARAEWPWRSAASFFLLYSANSAHRFILHSRKWPCADWESL